MVASLFYDLRMGADDWVLLAYRMPREPSTPRIAVWRKLRRLGALQLVDGLVALPADPATIEAFDWLADEVLEAGGAAWTWRARPGSRGQGTELVERANRAVSLEYDALLLAIAAAGKDPGRRTIDRFRRELRRVQTRDRFGSHGDEPVRLALQTLTRAPRPAGRAPS